ncbi:MAG: outer membrane beta-barrel family protein [Salinimicrobium sp.]
MKKFVLFLMLFSIHLAGRALPDPEIFGTVTGTVMDKEFQEPIPYATVSVKDSTGQIIEGTVSAVDGSFTLEKLPEGQFIFQIQFMGYKTFSQEVAVSKNRSSFDLGMIFLEAEVAQLDDVEIVAERSTIEQRIDRKIINVGKDLTTMGATAADIMNNIPSVSVDQDGNIALRGNSNVRVLLDGKPTNMDAATLLKTIPSTSIKKVELITNPSAKYNPEGMSGIINIVLHKNANLGFNGDLSAGVNIANHSRVNGNLNMNYRTGKFNFYTTLGANSGENSIHGYIRDVETGATEYPDLILGNTSRLGKLGLDFYLDDNNTLSFYTNQNLSNFKGRGNFGLRYPQEPERNYIQLLNTDEENLSSTYNFDYRHNFEKEGHEIELEVDYNRYNNDENTVTEYSGEFSPMPFDETVDRTEKTLLTNLDYVNPLTETTKLETGAEVRLRRTDNNYGTTNESLQDVFYTYDRDIYSFYTTFGQELGKWSYQLGARLESYNVEATQEGENIYEDDYFTLYPSAFVTFTPGEKNSFQLSYSRRVDRPSLGQVNPVRQLSTPRLTVTGNPALKPQFTNSVEFNYTRKIQKTTLSAGVFYRMINDEISQIVQDDPENPEHIILTFDNIGDNDSYGVELSASLEPLSFWDLNANFNFYAQTLQGYIGSIYLEKENSYYRLQANNTFKITKQFRMQLFGMYQSKMSELQFDIEDRYFINLGARYSFWNDKASLSLNLNDIFDTQVQKFSSSLPSPQEGELKSETRNLYLGFSYRFGGGKNRALQRKQRDDNTANGGGMF